MSKFLAEFIGTAILVLLGDGVCANVILNKSKGQNSGWIVITTGWGLAVGMAVFAVGNISGGHLNPAVTIANAVVGNFPWSDVLPYIAAQMLGAFVGAILVWLAYLPHWKETDDKNGKLGVFCTAPAVRNIPANFMTEAIGTMMLVMGGMCIGANKLTNGVATIATALLIISIGVSLGGPTGYAINPARDLGPRIAHAVLPIPGKRDADWGYAWVPVVGPIVGGIIGALIYTALF